MGRGEIDTCWARASCVDLNRAGGYSSFSAIDVHFDVAMAFSDVLNSVLLRQGDVATKRSALSIPCGHARRWWRAGLA